MADIETLQQIAAQLRQPQGEKGLEMAAMMHQSNWPMTKHCIDLLQLDAKQHILELGHGNAAHLDYLLKQQAHLYYEGLEISELMYEEAQHLNHTAIMKQQAHFQCYDGFTLPFTSATFDRIFSVNSIYFWQQPKAFLQALGDLLKPQGLINLTFADKTFMQTLPFTQFNFELYDLEQLQTLAESSNLFIQQHTAAQDQVKSKAGDWVNRHFLTVTLYKK
ncbi:class I SAM-dependent methyltransferase [Acinetobacter qingfengensis]|uniref:Methyltransferase type 11 domain-containing protein n=1 Tax=Acinetobacter qingfengensis TaxID=1262585 RepID=A0A1E7R4Z7_9GAMM|nr:class I SAM-dependent methyltransferase [Acinetobacter qingfengensis]KAA8732387.1 class I SAM-dependent methyltransferase [Acinetobacter qingfengensis]OEY94382.1 hypothetical protein BJI46_03305 [Acinetobacter qingfengensis]